MRPARVSRILRGFSLRGVRPPMSQHAEKIERRIAVTPPEAERAAEPRIYGLFPAQVRGSDDSGEPFRAETLLDNFSATEFDLRLTRRVAAGKQLFIVADIHEATIALHGSVLRAETQPDGAHRLTVSVTHYRFL
jgi:hypothetical protein